MKRILLLGSFLPHFTTTGCLIADERRHGEYRHREHYESPHDVIVVYPPKVVVRPPEIIVQ
jgi:hypothetical protein